MKYELKAYRFNNRGREMARYEQRFHVLEVLKQKHSDIKKQFPNYEILEGTKVISTNMKVVK